MPVSITRNPNLTKRRQERLYPSELQNHFGDKWWTGLPPESCPGFDLERQCLVALPLLNLDKCTRVDVLDYFNNSWTLTELLFQGIKTEEAYKRPPYHGLRHPLIFYYGHPAILYLNKMRLAGFYSKPVDLYLEKILETGVDEMSWDDMNKNEMEWPSVATIHAYREKVYTLISETIKTHPGLDFLDRTIGNAPLQNSPWWALWMGMEHEKIHFETTSVLIRELPIEFVETPKFWAPMHPSRTDHSVHENTWEKKSGEKVIIGKPKSTPSFGWDNEYGQRIVNTRDFQYTKFQITNREYFDFVASGAYINDSYWGEEGSFWRKFRNTKRPTFWSGIAPEGSHEYELRTIFEFIPMPWNWPVEVNFHEAQAYINWKNEQDKKTFSTNLHYRLMTEAEFHSLSGNEERPNFNFSWSTPMNVTKEFAGNAWHWVEDQFNPLPGFEVHPYYDDFSTPCFDGKHQMILGGSFMSTGEETRHYARFHFRPHFHQHTGFRMAASLDGSPDNFSVKLLTNNEYSHYSRQNVLNQMQPGLENVSAALLNYKKEFFRENNHLHLNNAGLAPISKSARDKIHYWGERFYQEGFYADLDYMSDVLHSRSSLSKLIGCNLEEIAFFQSTAGAISQLCFHFPLNPNDEVLTWDQEYNSNLYPWQEACRRAGAQFSVIPSEKNLTTPVEKIIEKITAKTKVIAISWVQFLTGARTDLKTLSKITREKNIFLFVDVMQGLGLHPFNMKEWGVDAVSGGSHKWLTSPVGVGFLALDMKHMNKIKPHNVGAYTFGTCDDPTDLFCEPKKDALKFEAGSKQVLEITALGASIDLILKTQVEVIEKEILRLSKKLQTGLLGLGYEVYYNNSSIVNFFPRNDTAQKLRSLPCSVVFRGPGIRLSPHAFNTDEDIERVLKALS